MAESLTVKELIATLGFDIDSKPMEQFEAGISQLKAGILGLTVELGGATFALYETVKTTAEAGKEIYNAAQSVGVSTDAFQKLTFAAEQAGLSSDDFRSSLALLNRHLFQASIGSEESIAAFRKVGISYEQLKNGSITTEQALQKVSQAVGKMPEGFTRAGLVTQFFGRSGSRLLPFLLKAPGEIRALGDEAEEMGFVMSESQIQMGRNFTVALHLAETSVLGIKRQVGLTLMPTMQAAVEAFTNFVKVNRQLITTNVAGFLRGVSAFLKDSIAVGQVMAQSIATIAERFGGAEKATRLFLGAMAILSGLAVLAGLGKLMLSLEGVTMALLKLALTASIPAIEMGLFAAAVYLIIDDFSHYYKGENSIAGIILGDLDRLGDGFRERFPTISRYVDFFRDAVKVYRGQMSFGEFWTNEEPQDAFERRNGIQKDVARAQGNFPSFNTFAAQRAGANSMVQNNNITVQAPVTVTSESPFEVSSKIESGMTSGANNFAKILEQVGRNTATPFK